jgi:hypothetical protein
VTGDAEMARTVEVPQYEVHESVPYRSLARHRCRLGPNGAVSVSLPPLDSRDPSLGG